MKPLRTIESTFATVGARSKITKGPGARAAGIAMAFKLIEAAQSRWRARPRWRKVRERTGFGYRQLSCDLGIQLYDNRIGGSVHAARPDCWAFS
jgi:hypothetical protein